MVLGKSVDGSGCDPDDTSGLTSLLFPSSGMHSVPYLAAIHPAKQSNSILAVIVSAANLT